MNHVERLNFLIEYLLSENESFLDISIPNDFILKKQLFRDLINIRSPLPISKKFIETQDKYLKEEILQKGIVHLKDISQIKKGIYLWKGDITRLEVDAIVNAANSAMLGCFVPNHKCIDNAIHTYSGVQLRLKCKEIMDKKNTLEKTGNAEITPAYNLPSKYILHTVGPIISGEVSEKDKNLLKSCYISCLDKAYKNNIKSIAFCCISTGEFHFPNDLAAKIAVKTVEEYLKNIDYKMEVIFNVFKEIDYGIYKRLLVQHN